MRWVLGAKGYQLHVGEKKETLFVSFDFVRHGTTNEVNPVPYAQNTTLMS